MGNDSRRKKLQKKTQSKPSEAPKPDIEDLNDPERAFRSCTGVLSSHGDSRDIHIDGLSIIYHGTELLMDTSLELNYGQRYGLIGVNGCGKSTLMSALASRDVPIPEHIDIFHLRKEMGSSEESVIDAVINVDTERTHLEEQSVILSCSENPDSQELLMDIYERLEEIEYDKIRPRASKILVGLGFTHQMQGRPLSSFSGGWRMRVSLARALLVRPLLLLLDEPTNHLDLESCVWLENELKSFKGTLVVVSHSQDFLNGICTRVLLMYKKTLHKFTGNYDSYVSIRTNMEDSQLKRQQWEQGKMQHLKNYIARFGHGTAKLARQAKSREKQMKRMMERTSTAMLASGSEKAPAFAFFGCSDIPPPVIMIQGVSFRYGDDLPFVFRDLEFGIDLDTRLALVGRNGAGKSTFLKLICNELVPTEGAIRRNAHLRFGRYHQHLQDILDLDMTALMWMMKQFPEVKEIEDMRRIVGRYGLSGQQQVCPMRNLSDGQRCRVTFAWLAWQRPHILLLDEPTNHLDMETIDALADALVDFPGGVILVSHDFRLISQVAEEIWICRKGSVDVWDGTIEDYKLHVLHEFDDKVTL